MILEIELKVGMVLGACEGRGDVENLRGDMVKEARMLEVKAQTKSKQRTRECR